MFHISVWPVYLILIVNFVLPVQFRQVHETFFVAEFTPQLKLKSYALYNNEPRSAIKLSNNNFLTGTIDYCQEIEPHPSNKVLRTLISIDTFSVGELENNKRLILDSRKLAEYSQTGKTLKEYLTENKTILDAFILNNEKIIINDFDNIYLINRKNKVLNEQTVQVGKLSRGNNNSIVGRASDKKRVYIINPEELSYKTLYLKEKEVESIIQLEDDRFIAIRDGNKYIDLYDAELNKVASFKADMFFKTLTGLPDGNFLLTGRSILLGKQPKIFETPPEIPESW
jgi:hypothetical protein